MTQKRKRNETIKHFRDYQGKASILAKILRKKVAQSLSYLVGYSDISFINSNLGISY